MVEKREGATSAIILHFTPGKPVEFPAEFVADIKKMNDFNHLLNDAHYKAAFMWIFGTMTNKKLSYVKKGINNIVLFI